MGEPKRTVKVQEIEGEPMRYRVESWQDPRLFHVVDLAELGGNGECDCRDFCTTCTRNPSPMDASRFVGKIAAFSLSPVAVLCNVWFASSFSMLTIKRNTLHSQSKNCWLYLQIGTVAFYFWRWWRRDNSDTAWRVELFTT